MEQLYKFIKATENNLPEDGFYNGVCDGFPVIISVKDKEIKKIKFNNGGEYTKDFWGDLTKKGVQILQQVIIPDDWADLYADFHHGDKTEANRAVWEDERENFIGGMNYIKSNLLAPLKGEDIEASNNKS